MARPAKLKPTTASFNVNINDLVKGKETFNHRDDESRKLFEYLLNIIVEKKKEQPHSSGAITICFESYFPPMTDFIGHFALMSKYGYSFHVDSNVKFTIKIKPEDFKEDGPRKQELYPGFNLQY